MMGYFPNGSAGMDYEFNLCNRCIHGNEQGEGMHDCPILRLHEEHNYEECNKPESFLHVLIPRAESGNNQACTMFIERKEEPLSIEDAGIRAKESAVTADLERRIGKDKLAAIIGDQG